MLLVFFIVVVIPGHNLGNSQVSVNRTIGPNLVLQLFRYPEKTCSQFGQRGLGINASKRGIQYCKQ